jgi:carboxymethylenebutenolidase
MRRFGLVVLGIVLLNGCDKGSESAPPESVVSPSAEQPDAPAEPMGLTGVLDEDAFKALHELKADAAPAPKGEEIELAGAKAYLSLPEDAAGPLPAVIVIHEWWGLNQHIKYWADRLAADGYAALAVDLYAGEVAETPEDAMKLMKGVDEARGLEIIKAAHAHLASDERIKASKRGVIGWCFGGGWSLQTAINVTELDAAIIYYGRLVEDEKQLSTIEAPLMGVFGNQDQGIPVEAVDGFEAAVKKAGKDIEVHRYDANHAFANPSSARYDHESATQAWEKTQAFFAEHLKGQ